MACPMPSGKPRGIALIFVLLLLATLATGSLALIASARHASQREHEEDLLFVGRQFARAIASYRASGGEHAVSPPTLEALLEDKRFPMPVRHLRRIFHDPLTGSAEWGVIRADGGIVGVYSLSTQRPIRSVQLPPDVELRAIAPGETVRYRDWIFMGTSAQP